MSEINSNKSKKICFYHPHVHIISGGLFYFYKLADFISKNTDYTVYVVNYKDSEYTKIYQEKFPDTNLKFLAYEDTYGKLDNDTIFFTYLNMLPLMLESFKHLNDAKIYLINFHPNSYLFLLNHLCVSKEKAIKNLFNIFYKTNSLTFMDKSCLDVVNECSGNSFSPNYIPAFLEKTNEEFANLEIVDKDKINIGCVCRLDVDKIHTVINFLDNLYNCEFSKPIRVHIIGDGTHRKLIDVAKYKDKLEVIMTSYIYGDDLKRYVANNIDIAFNFGVAGLDMAAQKLPNAIPMYEQGPHSIDRYYFLFDTKDYILGCKEELVDKYGIKTYTIKEIIELVYTGENKKIFGERCYEYLVNNHILEVSASKFLTYMNETSLTFETCLQYLPMKKLVEEFHIARKRGFNWDLFVSNKKSAKVYKNRISLAFYGILLILALIPFVKDHINLCKLQTKINKKINILTQRKRRK